MFVLSIIETALLLVYVAYLVNIYAQKQIPFLFKFITWISWLLSFGMVFILPHDIYYTLKKQEDGYFQIEQLWTIVYWLNFWLTWVVLPVIQDYEETGEFDWYERLCVSLKINIIRYIKYGAVCLTLLIILFAYNNWSWSTVLNITTALANAFGVLLIVVLLGDGLVAIPRDYWRRSKYAEQLENYYKDSVQLDTKRHELQSKVEKECTMLIHLKKYYTNHPLWFTYIEMVVSQIPYDVIEQCEHLALLDSPEQFVMSMERLIQLNRDLRGMLSEWKRAECKWDELCTNTFWLEDLQMNSFSVTRKVSSTLREERSGALGHLIDQLTWYWYTKLRTLYLRFLCLCFTTLSIAILLAEISLFTHSNLNVFAILDKDYSFINIQILVLIPLAYLSFCTFHALFTINFAGTYGFYNNQQTDAPSLMFGSMYFILYPRNFSRVAFPLAYNFLQLLKIDDTPFAKVQGDLDIGPIFGIDLSWALPVLLLLAAAFNYFEIYGRFQKQNCESWTIEEHGKKLLGRARVLRERELLNMNTSIFRTNKYGYLNLES